MKQKKIFSLLLCVILLVQPIFVCAFETDQFNLPPAPLADIGDEVSSHVEEVLRKAVSKLNTEIVLREKCLENRREAEKFTNCAADAKEREKLAYLRSNDAVAGEVYASLGTGLPPFTSSGSWMESHHFLKSPARYKTDYKHSIFTASPLNYLTISSTVRLYETEFGTDKIAHFFQQGFTYYEIYNRARRRGASEREAFAKAFVWGRKTERTIYGYWISRTFSNADLAANFAGLKFYLGLTADLKIGEEMRPAALVLQHGVWTFNSAAPISENLLRPFISNHFNEAFNPSIFSNVFGLRASVRKNIKARSCPQWLAKIPQVSKEELQKMTENLHLWHGEDYGFKDSQHFITVQNTCFD